MEINSKMELFDDSPVKKKRRKKNVKRPKSCIIHMDQTADDSTLSGFTEQSWKVIFHSILFEKFLQVTFTLISMKLYSTLLQNLKAGIYKFCNCTFRISTFKTVFSEFETAYENLKSFQTTVNASNIRCDNILTAFKEIPDSNEYGKHRTCYATYTHAKNLAKFKENYEGSSIITTETNSRITRTITKSCKLQFRYINLYSEQLLVLKKTVFDSFFLNYTF